MSRIGNKPIIIPEGVTVTINGRKVLATSKLGTLDLVIPECISLEQKSNEIIVKRANDERTARSLHGTTRSNIYNMIYGLHTPFTKELEIIGVGYRANLEGGKLVLQLGFSHNVEMEIPQGISVEVEKNVKLKISGFNKQLVGEFAANIRKLRKPEPYKGKGIKYIDEHVRRKAGKTAK